jgi:hypothetical protein
VQPVRALGRCGGHTNDIAGGDTTGGIATHGVLSTLNTGTTTPGADSNGTTQLASSASTTAGTAERITYTNTAAAAVNVYVRVLRASSTGNYTLGLSQ